MSLFESPQNRPELPLLTIIGGEVTYTVAGRVKRLGNLKKDKPLTDAQLLRIEAREEAAYLEWEKEYEAEQRRKAAPKQTYFSTSPKEDEPR